ncbi:MAG: bacterial regulatory s, gntR family protein [Bradyrhizobium sp.]|nr:bacterial regulatory s, gntR family protein [Bradyrhizobium sp.]
MTDIAPDQSPFLLSRGRAAEQIINDLRDKILQREYPRGSKLPTERELAKHYQVSTPTVREAIRGLSAVHLVEARHGTGVYVTAASDMMFAMAASTLIELENVQLLEVHDVLDPLIGKAAVLACANATDEELQRLVAVLNSLDHAGTTEEIAALLKQFLGKLAEASHNMLIATIGSFLSDLLIEIVMEDMISLGGEWKSIFSQLSIDRRSLAEALTQRNASEAERLAGEYHRHTRQLLVERRSVTAEDGSDAMRRVVKRVRNR